MIKSDNGDIEIDGTGVELLADFGCIAKVLMQEYGMETIMKTFAFVCARHIEEKGGIIT